MRAVKNPREVDFDYTVPCLRVNIWRKPITAKRKSYSGIRMENMKRTERIYCALH